MAPSAPFFQVRHRKVHSGQPTFPDEPAGEEGLLILPAHFLKPDSPFKQANHGLCCQALTTIFSHAMFRQSIIVSWNKVRAQLPVPFQVVSSNPLSCCLWAAPP